MRITVRNWLIALPLLFTACANLGPPEPPSLNLPKPPIDVRASRKGNNVILTWTIPTVTTDRQRIRSLGPTQICRGLQPELTECGTPVGAAPAEPVANTSKQKKTLRKKTTGPKVSESYTDVLSSTILSDNPDAYATYAVEVLNPDNRGAGLSNQVRIPLIRTIPAPADLNAKVTTQGVVLSWTSQSPAQPPPLVHYVYRVYRGQEGSARPSLVGEVPAGTQPSLTFTDSSIQWQKTYEYFVDAVAVITPENKRALEVPGEDSLQVKVFANDIFPPSVPTGLQAAYSGPGQPPFIDLIWAPDTEADLAGYNVYRRVDDTPPVKLTPEPVKTLAYRDTNVVRGETYFYSLSAVDVRGNESAHSEEASETVP